MKFFKEIREAAAAVRAAAVAIKSETADTSDSVRRANAAALERAVKNYKSTDESAEKRLAPLGIHRGTPLVEGRHPESLRQRPANERN